MRRGPRSSEAEAAPRGAPRWLGPVAAAAVPCLPFLSLLVAGETLWFRDFSIYFLPMKALLVELVRSAELPLWDPYVRNGLPFLANPQAGVFYPPSLLLVVFGLDPGLTLFLLLHLAAAGAGFYFFLRSARFGAPAAALGALAFAMSGYVASLVNVLNNLQTVAWVPWLFAFTLRLARRPARRDWFGLVLATVLSLLGGELQLAALALAAAMALALVAGGEAFERGSSGGLPAQPELPAGSAEAGRPASALGRLSARLRPAFLPLLAAAAACGLVAFQLLPTAELLRESVRSGGLPFELAADGSLAPTSLFSLAFPRPAVPGSAISGPVISGEMPWLLSAYLGASVVCLAFVGSAGRRRRWTLFWWIAASCGVLLALGSHTPLFRAAFELVPGFGSVRYPEKFLLLAALALPALAASGVESALAGRVPRAALVAGAALVLVSGAGSLLWMDGGVRIGPLPAAAAGALALGATLVVLLARARGRLAPPGAAALLCAIVALDLAWAGRAVNPSVPWRFYEEKPWAARVLEAERADPRSYRVRASPLSADMEQVAVVQRARFFSNHYFFQQSLAPNLGQLYGFLQQDGMAGIEARSTADQIDALVAQDPAGALRFLRLQAVRYIVTSFPLPTADVLPVARHPELPIAVVRLRGTLPRAYVAWRWRLARGHNEALRLALAEGFAPGSEVVLDREPFQRGPEDARAARAGTSPAGGTWAQGAGQPSASGSLRAPGVVDRAEWETASERFEVELDRPGILVVTDTWFPGWRAKVDGAPAPLLVANGYQRGVALGPGRHRVELEYRPASFAAGVGISCLMALALAGAAWRTRSRVRSVEDRPDAVPAEGKPGASNASADPSHAAQGSLEAGRDRKRRPATAST